MARKPQKAKSMDTHVVDILGNVKGRDQPVMLLNEAIKFVQHLDKKVLSADGYVFLIHSARRVKFYWPVLS